MKNKIVKSIALISLVTFSFLTGLNINKQPISNSIPIADIAEMKINDDGYYQLTLKDIGHIDDDINNVRYDEVLKIINK
ncbi:hypothetical protein [Konateibacter massiliensis]|uniref:hypothetical protein n=1 Tax=Konateibacter massiliensis TaxID=2002841 RepID=UPI000C159F07|nr:hypothetical protein [Konateibacter massiliensis]